MFQQSEEPRFTIEQIDLLQRLRRTGISQVEVLHALDTLDHLDRQNGHKQTRKASYLPPSSSLSSSNSVCASSSTTSTSTQTVFPDNRVSLSPGNNLDITSPPLPVPLASPVVVQNGLTVVANGKLSPPRFPLAVVGGSVMAPAFGFEASEEDLDLDDKVEFLMRRDSSVIKEEIKSFLANRRISQAVVAQVTDVFRFIFKPLKSNDLCHNRRHHGHASCPIGSGGCDGLAPNPAPICLRPWGLQAETRQQVHLEEGVPGCHGEVPPQLPSWFSALARGGTSGQRSASQIGRSLVSGSGSHAEGSRLTGVSWSPSSPTLQDESGLHSVLSEPQDLVTSGKTAASRSSPASANQADGAGCSVGNQIKMEDD
ncbi:hypothetical protein XENOCAPTIV_009484 [Xenoophorus captivus]|uniref:Homeobox containing 1a n=1 Tax=Xenoophorus captivus TaxID=1517983 RepID=A0ABV0QU12_9TELE